MLTPAFSSVACPEWTLDRIAKAAAEYGYPAVELRTFGDGSLKFAHEPALTGSEKIRAMFSDAGVSIVSLATSISFHHAVDPPVLGHAICDNEDTIRAARRAIDLASTIECPLVRVFGYQLAGFGGRSASVGRIADRLTRVIDHAHHTGVKVMIENAGDFSTAAEIMEIVDAVTGRARTIGHSPLIGVCYNAAVGQLAGDDPVAAVNVLGEKLFALRLKNVDAAGRPVSILQPGAVNARAAFDAARMAGLNVPVIFEWDRAWVSDLASAESVLPAVAPAMFGWMTGAPNSADARNHRTNPQIHA